MTIGSMFQATCYPSQMDAATAACSTFNAVAADGSRVGCINVHTPPTPSSTSGGNFPVLLDMTRVDAGGAVTSYTQSVKVLSCERYDYAYWSDAMGAWVAAAVAIIAARIVYTRVFNRETL